MRIKLVSLPLGVLMLAVLILNACASVVKDPVPPRVQLLGLQLQEVQLIEQRYLMKIRIQNPNDFDLDIQGVDFRIELNGEHFAQGLTSKPVNVPGFGEAITQVIVSSSVISLVRQLNNGRLRNKGVKYRFSGRVKLAGIPVPVSFATEGDLASLLQGG